MASGTPGGNRSPDPDDLLRSGARSGLKREFAFILRSQANSALSRTRSGHSSASNPDTLNKRAKKSPLAADQSPIPPIPSPAAAAAASIQNETHAANLDRSPTTKAGMALPATPGRRFTRSALKRLSMAGEGDPAAGSKTNVDEQSTAVQEIPGDVSNMQTSVFTAGPSKSSKKRRIKLMKSKKQIDEDGGSALIVESVVPEKLEKANVGLQTPVSAAGQGKSKLTMSNKQTDEDGSGAVPIPVSSNKQIDEDGSGAVPIPVSTVAQGKKKTDEDGCGAPKVDNVVLEKSKKLDVAVQTPISTARHGKAKFTRSKKRTGVDDGREHKFDSVVPEKQVVDGTLLPARRFTRSALNTPKIEQEMSTKENTPKIKQEMSTKETPTAKHDGDECKVGNSAPEKRVLRSTRSTVEKFAAKHDDECKVRNSAPEKRVLRFTRSTVEKSAAKHDDECKADDSTLGKRVVRFTRSALNSTPGKRVVRFTRSALNAPVEDSDSEAESTETDTSESSDSEEMKSRHKPRKTLKKKMELKMSKKIGLSKLPANVRDLFATGLLEGYPVKYNCNDKQQISLEGVIRGNAISCNCPSCKGSKTFSGYNWEVHAGSSKKHPSDYIFLENGKSLHDVLKACTSAPLNMLEATIQNVIGAPPRKRPSICQTCGVSFRSSHTGEPALSCDSCLKTEQRQPNASSSSGTQSIGKSGRTGSLPNPCNNASLSSSAHKSGKITKKDIGLHKLVFMDDILPEGTEVAYYHHGERLLDGYIKDSGIYCLHCNVVVKPSVFEAHAGRASRRKPFHNIYTSNGVSLHELSVSLSKGRKLSTHENDDLCNKCNDGGDLLLCDLCPRSFHKECVGLLEFPEGDWHCPPCQTMHQKEKFVEYNDNAIAAGRVPGVDPIEQIIKRCIRIFTSPGTDVGGCVLCRLHDFSKAAFGDRTVLICDQCEKEYHVGCLREHNMCDLKALPEDDWFCCADCQRINAALQELLLRGQQPLKDLDADIIRKKQNEFFLSEDGFDVSWRLLSGKTPSADSMLLLSETVSLFSEAFDPIVGVATGQDLIPSIVNGEDMGDQDFGGMYCVVLTSNSHIVSAGILRILGSELAELPLVATSREVQGQGYFQALFSCIERLLGSLNVKHFVLPAAEEALSIWTKKFGFTEIASDQLREYAKGVHPMVFHGTSLLHKPVPGYQDSS